MSTKKLEFAERDDGGSLVIEVIGELTVASGSERVLEKVREKIAEGKTTLLVNLAQCRRVDSSGLGELVTCLVTAARHDATLRLTNVPQHILGIMKVTNVHKAFEIFDTEEAALKSK